MDYESLDPKLAWKYYLAYVAQSLACEIQKWLPWSIGSFSAGELELLFDSRSLFEYNARIGRNTIQMNSPIQPVLFRHGPATPGDPCRTFAFLRTNSMIGTSPRSTIERVLEWCRTNLLHYTGRFEPANLQSQWQYSGWPPVERVISGSTSPYLGFGHYTAGCWGTTGFLRALLRTANIPVTLEVVSGCGHAFTRFVHENLFLSHGDDPYSPLIMATPAVPIGEVLIDRQHSIRGSAQMCPR